MIELDNHFVVFATAPDDGVAATLAREAVEARLAACINVLPGVRSFYQWDGEIKDDAEVLLVAKTDGRKLQALIAQLAAAHPYDCPEIVALPIAHGLPAYLEWVSDTIA
jgi:periplasmic divalent cation tolerance protein